MLARLAQPSTVTGFVDLNFDDSVPADGVDVIAIGHGRTSFDGPLSEDLLQVAVPVVPHATCNGDPGFDGDINDASMICAGATGLSACNGDSGGNSYGQTVFSLTSTLLQDRCCSATHF